MKKPGPTHAENTLTLVRWLFSHPEPVRDSILKEIYPDIKDPVIDILFHHSLNDSLSSFAPAIIRYATESKGAPVFAGNKRVTVAAETVEVVTCMAVGEEPDIPAVKLLFIIRRAIHYRSDTFLNQNREDFDRMYDRITPEVREYKCPK